MGLSRVAFVLLGKSWSLTRDCFHSHIHATVAQDCVFQECVFAQVDQQLSLRAECRQCFVCRLKNRVFIVIARGLVTVETLMLHKVIRRVLEHINVMVLPKEIYPEYEYVQLSPENIRTLELEYKRFMNEDEYVTQASEACKCAGVHKEEVDNNVDNNKYRKLKKAKYQTLKMNCENSKLFCTFLNVHKQRNICLMIEPNTHSLFCDRTSSSIWFSSL